MSSHSRMKCAVLLRPWVHGLLLPHLPIHRLSLTLLPQPWGPQRACALRLIGYGLSWRLLPPHNQWRRENQDQHKAHETRHLTSECARSLLVSSCCRHTHSLHTTSRGSSCPRVCTHLIHAWSERHSSTLSSPFHSASYSSCSPSISSSSCCPCTSTRTSSNTVYSANKEMGSTDESYSHTGFKSPKTTTSRRLMSSPSQSLTQQQFTEQRFLEDVDYDNAALEEMLENAHREHVYHSQREGLSVGQSSSSVSERTERPVVERTGRPDRGSTSSPTVRRRLRNTNSRLIMTEEVYKNWVKLYWISAGRTSSRSSRRTSTTRSTTSSCTVIAAKLGFTWSSW